MNIVVISPPYSIFYNYMILKNSKKSRESRDSREFLKTSKLLNFEILLESDHRDFPTFTTSRASPHTISTFPLSQQQHELHRRVLVLKIGD